MTTIPEVKPIQLTPDETNLRQEMENEYSRDSGYTGKAANRLFKSLRDRGAIPQVRLDDFTKPFPGGRGKSHRDVFVSKGCSGDAIFEHSHFVPFLRYFIDGPALPSATIERIRKIVVDDAGTTIMVMTQLEKAARDETRKLRLDPHAARDEFQRLMREFGYQHAENISTAARDAARRA